MKANKIANDITDYVYEKDSWLYWKKLYSNKCRQKIGSLAGCLHKNTGYYGIMINGVQYLNHRILYQIYHNVILKSYQQIDHINRDKTDNRKENLKITNQQQNSMNRTVCKHNKLGLKNISIQKTRYWYKYYHIQIKKYGVIVFEKCYRTDRFTEQEVIKIRDEELIKHHGDFHSFG